MSDIREAMGMAPDTTTDDVIAEVRLLRQAVEDHARAGLELARERDEAVRERDELLRMLVERMVSNILALDHVSSLLQGDAVDAISGEVP